MEQMKGPPIGIDLGTAYTCAAFYNGSCYRVIPDEQGNSAMPSYVAFTDSGVLVGEAARRQASQNPTNTIFDIVHLIGRRYPSVRNDKRLWPFKVRVSTDGRLLVNVLWKGKLSQFTLVEICSMILIKIKENAEKILGAAATDAVMTVPVCFNYEQRQAMKQAGTIAGFNILQIISAPAASALFYGMERLSKISNTITNAARSLFASEPEEHKMIIIDLGAGTLDVAAVTIKENVCKVEGTAGDIHLGGSDFDNNLIDHFVNLVKKREKVDISSNPMAISNLRTSCEKAKIFLSSCTNSEVPVNITPLLYNDVDPNYSIRYESFHALNRDLFSKCINIIVKCLSDAKLGIAAVDEVILAGSSTRIPLLQSKIIDLFKGKEVIMGQNLETATACGAAFQAFSVSTSWIYKRVLCLTLIDVIPFSLGLKSVQGQMIVYVPIHTSVPTKKMKRLVFRNPNSTRFQFEVYEGEGRLTCENRLLGKFDLAVTHFSPVEREIDVTFEVHGDSALTVTAVEISSGIRNGITIAPNSTEDSKRRVWEALVHNVSESSIFTFSATKSSTSSTLGKQDQVRRKVNLTKPKPIFMKKEMSKKIVGQSSTQYVQPEEYAIGIDFGTTCSCVAVWQRNGVKIVENEYGSCLTSSAVAFTDNGRLIGDQVQMELVRTKPENIIPNIKRLIGRCSADQSIHDDNMFLPFRVRFDDKSRCMVSVQYKNEEKLFAAEEIAAMILSKMKEIAEVYLNSKVSKAVISVPAFFSNSQRTAIKDAGVIAGLNVMQLLNETTAAAIAYFLQNAGGQSCSEKKMLIFDLGGGHLDVSIVLIKKGCVRVQAVAGDTNLGGEDFDNNMVSYFVQKFMKEKKRDIHNKPMSLRRLRAACEKAKRVLSTNSQTVVEIDALDEGINFHSVITRKTFDELNKDLFKRSISCVEKCLEDAMIDRSCIDEVVLVGGSTRIPKMQQLLQEFFNGKELCKSINPDEAVVYGAAVQAAILNGNEDREKFNILELSDVTPLSLGFGNKAVGGAVNVFIPKNTPIPVTKEMLFTTGSDDLMNIDLEIHECELAHSTVFTLRGLPPRRAGNIKINVSCEVDNNGILNLTTKLVNTSERNEIVVCKENGGLTMEELQNMVKAEAHYKADDEEHKARCAALDTLETLAYKIKAEARDPKFSGSDMIIMEEAAEAAIVWLDTYHNEVTINEIDDVTVELEALRREVLSCVDNAIDAALNSLKILAYKMKAQAMDPGVPSTSKKSVEKAANDAIAWLERNDNAAIDEIKAQMMQLETIKSKIVYLGTNISS